jgi:hypothetical protein
MVGTAATPIYGAECPFGSVSNVRFGSTHWDPWPRAAPAAIIEGEMNTLTNGRLRRYIDLSDRWAPESDPGRLLGNCRALLLEAEELEAAASASRSEGLDPAVLGCLSATLSSLATASLLLDEARNGQGREHATGEQEADPSRLLFAISQNLRFAAEAAKLGQQALSGARDDTDR